MADLEQVISAAVADAGGGEGDTSADNTPDISSDISTDETTEVVDTPEDTGDDTPDSSADTSAAKLERESDKPAEKEVEKPAEKAKTPEDEQFEKDLLELGIKPPKEGERENRLPHSRVKVMMGKYGKKLTERHQAIVQAKEAEYAPLKQKAAEIDNVDRLIVTDPDRYIGILATLHPDKYGKFVKGGQVETRPAGKSEMQTTVEAEIAKLGPRPEADHKFEDGSMGYTPEQFEKREQWLAAKARIEAVYEAEERISRRFAPIEQAYKGVQARNQDVTRVRQEIAEVHEAYGKEFVDKHEDAIVAYMKANPKATPRQAADKVLIPLLRADRQKVRDEVTEELKQRPAAARKVAPGATTAGKESKESSGDPITDAITNAVATIRR